MIPNVQNLLSGVVQENMITLLKSLIDKFFKHVNTHSKDNYTPKHFVI